MPGRLLAIGKLCQKRILSKWKHTTNGYPLHLLPKYYEDIEFANVPRPLSEYEIISNTEFLRGDREVYYCKAIPKKVEKGFKAVGY
jgi:hypothetical protein